MRLTDGPAAGPSSLERSSCCLPLSAAAPQALRSWPEPPPRCRLFCCSPKGPTGNGGRHSASGGCLIAPFEAACRRMLFRCSPGGLAETRLRQGAPNGRQTACLGGGSCAVGGGFAPPPRARSTARTYGSQRPLRISGTLAAATAIIFTAARCRRNFSPAAAAKRTSTKVLVRGKKMYRYTVRFRAVFVFRPVVWLVATLPQRPPCSLCDRLATANIGWSSRAGMTWRSPLLPPPPSRFGPWLLPNAMLALPWRWPIFSRRPPPGVQA